MSSTIDAEIESLIATIHECNDEKKLVQAKLGVAKAKLGRLVKKHPTEAAKYAANLKEVKVGNADEDVEVE